MKHARFADIDGRESLADPVPRRAEPDSREQDGPVRHGYGAVQSRPRSLALGITIALHAGLLALLAARAGFEAPSSAPGSTSIATFNVAAPPAPVVSEPEPPAQPPESLASKPPVHRVDTKDSPLPGRMASTAPVELDLRAPAKQQLRSAQRPSEPVKTLALPKQSAPKEAAQPEPAAPDAAMASKEASNAYGAAVMAHLRRSRRPNSIGPGSTIIRFTVSPGGGVESAAIGRSSGSKQFDREALDMVRRAAPFPKPPTGVNRDFAFEVTGQ